MSVRARIVAVYSFSSLAKLLAEDGRWLVLTRHASGFNEIGLCEGNWLACELGPDGRILACAPCPAPSNASNIVPQDARAHAEGRERKIAQGLRQSPTLHRVAPPSQVPLISMSSWQVSEMGYGGRFVWGYDEGGREGRVSSLLTELDPGNARLRSVTGTQYQLVGQPGFNPDAEYVWRSWLSMHGYSESAAHPVTEQVWQAIQEAAGSGLDRQGGDLHGGPAS
jgi:hypothetical protein